MIFWLAQLLSTLLSARAAWGSIPGPVKSLINLISLTNLQYKNSKNNTKSPQLTAQYKKE